MTVDLGSSHHPSPSKRISGNGSEDIIRVKKTDLPHSVAYNFCLKHGLNIDLVEVLSETIAKNM